MKRLTHTTLIAGILASVAGPSFADLTPVPESPATFRDHLAILSDPYLTGPTAQSVDVAWFTEGPGDQHFVQFGEDLLQTQAATSSRMTRMFEDRQSNWNDPRRPTTGADLYDRDVWRHEATITGLPANVRTPYRAVSVIDGVAHASEVFTLQPLPTEGHPVKIVLTSDQQNREMSPATFQMLMATEPDIDGIFFAGDFVDTPHRASEWFDRSNSRRPAFFPSMQGFYRSMMESRWTDGSPLVNHAENPYEGGQLLQNAWLLGTIGNHESPGLWRPGEWTLDQMDNEPQPRWFAEIRYEQNNATINPTDDPAIRQQWIQDNSYEFTQYFEMWNHPNDGPGGEEYYALKIGDVFLISMHVNRVWRNWNNGWRGPVTSPSGNNNRGKMGEPRNALNNPLQWGFGDMFFQRYSVGTAQHDWLLGVLASDDFRNAKYRVVLAHQTGFGFGDNSTPVMAEPIATIDYVLDGNTANLDPSNLAQMQTTFPMDRAQWESVIEPLLGSIVGITYDYPLTGDIWKHDIEPLLIEHGVHLVQFGHSHLWNRSRVGTLNYIETSNYGNSFGTAWKDEPNAINERRTPWATYPQDRPDADRFDPFAYPRFGDAQGRPGIFPNLANPEFDFGENPAPVPYVASNEIGVFSILDTGTGTVRSYAFDWRRDGSSAAPVLFDEFPIVVTPTSSELAISQPDAPNFHYGDRKEFTFRLTRSSGQMVSYRGGDDLSGLNPLLMGPEVREIAITEHADGTEDVLVGATTTGDRIFVKAGNE